MRESAARIVPAGTLLVAMYGQGVTRGRTAILGIDAAINQACAAISPKGRVTADFLYQVFAHGYERIRDLSHGAHQLNLSLTLLREVRVPLPLPEEQAEIVRRLTAVDGKLAAEAARRDALGSLFDRLLHDLMTGRRRVGDCGGELI